MKICKSFEYRNSSFYDTNLKTTKFGESLNGQILLFINTNTLVKIRISMFSTLYNLDDILESWI